MTQIDPGQAAMIEESSGPVEWEMRPYQEGDIPGMVALINAVDEAYKLQGGTSEEEMRTSLASPRSDPERQIVIVEGPRIEDVPPGTPIGFGRVNYDNDDASKERIYFPRVVVHPAAEGKGLERVIAKRLIEIIRGYEQDPSMKQMEKVWVKVWTHEARTPIRVSCQELGLREVRWFWTMARDLGEPVDEPPLVEGVTIRNCRLPDDNRCALEAFNDSFSDHWDHHPVPEEDWLHWISTPNIRPDLSWLAEEDITPGKIVGFCICMISEEDNRRKGVREGWIELLGTTRDWRRKGLGRTLLLHGLHSLKSAGMDTALLGVDSDSLTGAQRLYESVGFRIRNREVQYECLLEDVKL